ncbi:hypothetical protein EKG51_04875 [Salmonella enterica subsp. enterica serovar Montevideo]|nr:hypothetical protein [Salmonella enterica subsp. enterica serovar Montevideo]
MLCVVLAVPACTLASGWYRPFYKTDKGITGRRAHNPIHPGAREVACLPITIARVPFSVVYGETNFLAPVQRR